MLKVNKSNKKIKQKLIQKLKRACYINIILWLLSLWSSVFFLIYFYTIFLRSCCMYCICTYIYVARRPCILPAFGTTDMFSICCDLENVAFFSSLWRECRKEEVIFFFKSGFFFTELGELFLIFEMTTHFFCALRVKQQLGVAQLRAKIDFGTHYKESG